MPRKLVGFSLVLGWGTFIVIAFWLFTYKNLRLFADEQDVLAKFPADVAQSMTSIGPLPTQSIGRLIHFWNPACRCSRFSQSHVEEIITSYEKQGIDFVVAVPNQSLVDRALTTFPRVSDVIVINNLEGLSSPSAVIFDSQNTLVYFGPYSDGAFCSSDGSTPVEQVLDGAITQQSVTPWLNLSTFGCYCDWPN